MNIELSKFLTIAAPIVSIFSLIVSVVSVFVSIFSLLYTKKQSEIAEASHINDYRSKLTQHHSVYKKNLEEIDKKHRSELNELKELAGTTLKNIILIFDKYDTKNLSNKLLRHLLNESSEMVFLTFQGQLAWQRSENISWRLHNISFIEDQLDPSEQLFGRDFRRVIKEQYMLNRNRYLEEDLIKDIYFCDLVSEMKSRISWPKIQFLTNDLEREIHSFIQLHSSLKSGFSESSNQLEELINRGNKELFQLKESYQLFKDIKKKQTTLNTLSHLNFPDKIDKTIYGKSTFFISQNIYICTLLHAIHCLDAWGWE